jgi:plastocyanin
MTLVRTVSGALKCRVIGAAGVAVFALFGCGNSSVPKSAEVSTRSIPTKTVDPATAGSISGRVTLAGKPPELHAIDMGAEPACAKEYSTPVIAPTVVADSNGNLANAVVYIKAGVSDYAFHAPSEAAKLLQKGCMYEPHVTALMVGQNLDVANDDQTTHNVFMMSQNNRPSNRSSLPGSAPLVESLGTPELAIPMKCNVHPWMKGYVFVFDHPYFAVTRPDGKFELNGLPPGTYTLVAWQELYGAMEQTVTVAPPGAVSADFVFKAQ